MRLWPARPLNHPHDHNPLSKAVIYAYNDMGMHPLSILLLQWVARRAPLNPNSDRLVPPQQNNYAIDTR